MTDVMVVAVHPDDETLGCAGTLLRHKEQGANIHLLLITAMYYNDENNRTCTIGSDGKDHVLPECFYYNQQHISFSKEAVKIKAEEVSSVIDEYGFSSVNELNVPTTTVSLQDESVLVNKVASVFLKARPHILYLPFFQDAHGDHRAIFPILNSCIKTFRYPFIEKVYMMETISETEYALPAAGNTFTPNHFVCIDKWMDQKISIMEKYENEIQESPLPRSEEMIRAQSRFRGAMANCKYAEAFMLFKEVIK
ncbi:MAG: PIG-L family deacetylase [Desulfobacteraceae bacterium]|nr:PIG-L family deacetylase [Desulfobacteraceae bacterium]